METSSLSIYRDLHGLTDLQKTSLPLPPHSGVPVIGAWREAGAQSPSDLSKCVGKYI